MAEREMVLRDQPHVLCCQMIMKTIFFAERRMDWLQHTLKKKKWSKQNQHQAKNVLISRCFFFSVSVQRKYLTAPRDHTLKFSPLAGLNTPTCFALLWTRRQKNLHLNYDFNLNGNANILKQMCWFVTVCCIKPEHFTLTARRWAMFSYSFFCFCFRGI